MRSRMLITGVSGLLGSNLAHYFRDKYQVLGLFHSHCVEIPGIRTVEVDLLRAGSVAGVSSTFRPDVVIHCAALANIERCEEERELTRDLNVHVAREIAGCPGLRHAYLVFPSSDSVYDGLAGGFREDEGIGPRHWYGRSKYEGEQELLGRDRTLVLRSNLFGWNIHGATSLAEWVLHRLRAGKTVHGFEDVRFSTIYTMEMARVIDLAVASGLEGIYNCGSSDSASKYEFALMIAERFGFDRSLVQPVSIDDSELKVARGKDLSMNVVALESALDYRLPTIGQSVDMFYKDHRCGMPDVIGRPAAAGPVGERLIRYGSQAMDSDDVDAVARVMLSTNLTQGPKVAEFEAAVAEFCGAKYGVAVSSGTAALHIACLAAGLNGGESITTPNTFVASANCAVYCGVRPVFADIDSVTYNVTAQTIAGRITDATAAVVPVAFAGQSCDMAAIREVVDAAGGRLGRTICVIEDASHALGSEYRGGRVGSCAWSEMAVLSFHPVKHITTGEGGMVLTNDSVLDRRLRRFRSHGITNLASELLVDRSPGPWYYEQQDLGFNYRITDMQCALGVSQLGRLPEFMARRREIVQEYNEAFAGADHLRVPTELQECRSNFHLYVLLIDFAGMGTTRAALVDALIAKGIQTQVHYIPVHTQPFFRARFGTDWGDCPKAEAYYERCLSIPLHPGMSDGDVRRVIEAVLSLTGAS